MTDTLLGPVLIPEVLNAGYNFDFIDDRAMAKAGIPYKVLILPGVERIPLETMQRLQDYAAKGGLLVATRSLPSLGPGLLEEKRDSSRIAAISHELFETGSQRARFVEQEQGALRSAHGNAATGLRFGERRTRNRIRASQACSGRDLFYSECFQSPDHDGSFNSSCRAAA